MLTMGQVKGYFSPLVVCVALLAAGCAAGGSTTAEAPTVEVLAGALTARHEAPTTSTPAPASTTTTATPTSATLSSTIPVNPACSNSFAFTDENPKATELSNRIDAALNHPGFAGHDVSVSVWVDGWGEIATHNPNLRLHPASNQKVLTAIAANGLLDGAAPLTTNIELLGQDLIIRAGADPTLTFPRLMGAIDDALPEVNTPIKRIIIDVTDYPQDTAADGWLERHVPQYVGPLSGLMLNGNRWTTGSDLVHNPDQLNGERIASFLEEREIDIDSVYVSRVIKPAVGETIATIESASIQSLVGSMLLTSSNATADLLLMELGRVASGEGTLAGGAQAVESVLYETCGSLDGLIDDGSGLSRENWRSARSFVQSISALHGTSEGELLRSQMPVGGVSGTLAGRFGGSNAGRVQAKTGTLFTARSLSGWAKMTNGRDAVFSVIVNGERDTMGGAVGAIDALVKEIIFDPATLTSQDEVSIEEPVPYEQLTR